MKKTIFTILAIAAFAATAFAQEDTALVQLDKTDYVSYHHNIQLNIGGGLSTLGYQPQDAKWKAGAGAKLEVLYQYKFNPNWGIGAGLGISSLHSAADYDFSYQQAGLTHPDNGREYTSLVDFQNWRERQNVLNFDIPVRVFYTLPLTYKWALEFGAGLTLNVPVYNNYKCKGTDYEAAAWFPSTNVTYQNLPNHGLGYYSADQEKGKNNLRGVNLSMNLDAGAEYAIRENLSFYMGIYAGYGFINSVKKHDLQPLYNAEIPDYVGSFQSDRVSAAHPVEFGAKIGLRFGVAKRMKKADPLVEYLTDTVTATVHDTVTATVHDTVIVKEKVKVVENSILNEILASANFKTGSDAPIFQSGSDEVFERLKKAMDEDPESVIVISGHTDNTGGDERNMELGQQRADAFRKALVERGVDGKRIITVSYGKERPIADNDTPEGRAKNRRVELKMK